MIFAALPALPDAFGNYALGDFAEAVAPESISWWPSSVGWKWLALVVVVFIARILWLKIKNWHANRYRREARHRLQQLQTNNAPDDFLQELNKLLKLTAIAGFSRERVASLSGQTWAEFLNAQCDEPPFSTEHYQWLSTGPYTAFSLKQNERAELCDAATQWIETHQGQRDA